MSQLQIRTRLAWLILASVAATASAENWPQWRGPSNNGISREVNLPTQWGDTQNVLWKLELPGKAGSTPVIWGDRVFLTSAAGKEDLVLICADTTGKQLWQQVVSTGNRGRSEGNNASPSPSTDGNHVWVFFGTGILACYDFDGKQQWRVDIQERYGKFRLGFGMHMTPVLHGDHLYLQLIHSNGAWVIAIEKNTGKEAWKVERKSDGVAECEHSYASPVVWSDGTNTQLVTHGNDYAIGHNLADGSERWRLGDLNPKTRYNRTLRFVASPVATKELIVIPSAKNGPVVGLSPAAKGNINLAEQKHASWWREKNTPDVPSPLVYDGLVYLCRESGHLICMDAATGEEQYSESVHRYKHRASPVAADGHIYLTGADGTVSVVKAGRTYQLVAQNKLDDPLLASPVVSGGRIYLRGFKALYAIGKK